MLYLDANFFVFALLEPDGRGKKAREIQKEIIAGKESAVVSALTLDEVMWVLLKNKKGHLLKTVVNDIYSTPNLEVVEVQGIVPMEALVLMERYSLKPRDAFHVAVMKLKQLDTIVSDDSDFDRVKEVKRLKL